MDVVGGAGEEDSLSNEVELDDMDITGEHDGELNGSLDKGSWGKNKSLSDKEKKSKKKEKHTKSLEVTLKVLHNRIKKLRTMEVDLDDEESPYVLEERYLKKFDTVWKKLCELNGRAVTTGRPTERKITFTSTRFPQINQKLTRFLNKYKTFPDYKDVYSCVQTVNKADNLALTAAGEESIARTAFSDIGDLLQERRRADLWGHHTAVMEDDATTDTPTSDELKQKLQENKEEGRRKLNEVVDMFAEQGGVVADVDDDYETPSEDESCWDKEKQSQANGSAVSDVEESDADD